METHRDRAGNAETSLERQTGRQWGSFLLHPHAALLTGKGMDVAVEL